MKNKYTRKIYKKVDSHQILVLCNGNAIGIVEWGLNLLFGGWSLSVHAYGPEWVAEQESKEWIGRVPPVIVSEDCFSPSHPIIPQQMHSNKRLALRRKSKDYHEAVKWLENRIGVKNIRSLPIHTPDFLLKHK